MSSFMFIAPGSLIENRYNETTKTFDSSVEVFEFMVENFFENMPSQPVVMECYLGNPIDTNYHDQTVSSILLGYRPRQESFQPDTYYWACINHNDDLQIFMTNNESNRTTCGLIATVSLKNLRVDHLTTLRNLLVELN